jgi:hypothetical protein
MLDAGDRRQESELPAERFGIRHMTIQIDRYPACRVESIRRTCPE